MRFEAHTILFKVLNDFLEAGGQLVIREIGRPEDIDALPEKLRQVVVLCELSGLSYEEIARTLEIPVGTVGSRRSAALARLAVTLGPIEEDA